MMETNLASKSWFWIWHMDECKKLVFDVAQTDNFLLDFRNAMDPGATKIPSLRDSNRSQSRTPGVLVLVIELDFNTKKPVGSLPPVF